MKLRKIIIKNYRLLKDVELRIDDITAIVGKNNTGKTSLMSFIQLILSSRNKQFSFNDYPISLRNDLYQYILNVDLDNFDIGEIVNVFREPSIRMEVDYSLENEHEHIGMLRPFIIDLEVSVDKAILEARFDLIITKEKFKDFVNKIRSNKDYNTDEENNKKNVIREHLIECFSHFYKLSVYAIDPENEDVRQLKTQEDLKRLLSVHFIRAERVLDESDEGNEKPLEKLLESIFEPIIDLENGIEVDEGERKQNLKNYEWSYKMRFLNLIMR